MKKILLLLVIALLLLAVGVSAATITVQTQGAGQGNVVSSPLGINCGNGIVGQSSCSKGFASGNVVLTAKALQGSTFAGWAKATTSAPNLPSTCAAASTICTLPASQARTVKATFNLVPVTRSLTITKVGTGAVESTDPLKTSTTLGINCGITCFRSYSSQRTVKLKAVVPQGSTMTWTNCNPIPNKPATECQVVVDGAKTVTATFTAAAAGGTANTVVTLYANGGYKGSSELLSVGSKPKLNLAGTVSSFKITTGYVAVLYEGETQLPPYKTFTSDVSDFAHKDLKFDNKARSATVRQMVCGDGIVDADVRSTVTNDEVCDSRERIACTPPGQPAVGGYKGTQTCATDCKAYTACEQSERLGDAIINGPEKCDSTNFGILGNSCVREDLKSKGYVGGTLACKADGTLDESGCKVPVKLSVGVTPATGGRVDVVPGPLAGKLGEYAPGTQVTLTPVAAQGYYFKKWNVGCPQNAPGVEICTVTLDSDTQVTAEFGRLYTLKVTKAGDGTGAVSYEPGGPAADGGCVGADCISYEEGTTVVLTATPADGSEVEKWVGGDRNCGTEPTCSVTMNAKKDVTVMFIRKTLTFVYPAGGETLIAGESVDFSWTYAGTIQKVDIAVGQRDSAGNIIAISGAPPYLAQGVDNTWDNPYLTQSGDATGSHRVYIPSDFPPGPLVIRITEPTGGVNRPVDEKDVVIEAPRIELHKVVVENGNVRVVYSKNFGTSAHLYHQHRGIYDDGRTRITHYHNSYGEVGDNVEVTVPLLIDEIQAITPPNPPSGAHIIPGEEYVLCHGNSGPCSEPVIAEGCGDAIKSEVEQCDFGSDNGGAVSESADSYSPFEEPGYGEDDKISYSCSQACVLTQETVKALRCGDNIKQDAYEQCDGSDGMSRITCTSPEFADQGFADVPGKAVTCNQCAFDTSQCVKPVKLTVVTEGAHGWVQATKGSDGSIIDCGRADQRPATRVCTAQYTPGTAVVLLPVISRRVSRFESFSVPCQMGPGGCTFTIGTDVTVTARFVSVHELSVSFAGAGSGSVAIAASAPEATTTTRMYTSEEFRVTVNSDRSCNSNCKFFYDEGEVTLTVTPAGNSEVESWGGACAGTPAEQETCDVAMDAAKTVTVTFKNKQVCGNSIPEGTETCDDGNTVTEACVYGEQSCQVCSDQCQLVDGEVTAYCGDTVQNIGPEVCDGGDLAGQQCTDHGFTAGTLGCAAACDAFDTSACTRCGDGTVDPDEECDGNAQVCDVASNDPDAAPYKGSQACTAQCAYEGSACVATETFGDGIVNGPEQCDPGADDRDPQALYVARDFAGSQVAASDDVFDGSLYGLAGPIGGQAVCTSPSLELVAGYAYCGLDVRDTDSTYCTTCGDGEVDPGEQCDGSNLNGKSCTTEGFAGGGTLGCTDSCQFETGQCVVGAPDLIVEDAYFADANGAKVTSGSLGVDYSITRTIKNVGTVRASHSDFIPIRFSFTKDGAPSGALNTVSRVRYLDPGQSDTSYTMQSLSAGTYCIVATVDPLNVIAESNDNNNNFPGTEQICIDVVAVAPSCTPSWQCTAYDVCSASGTQTRTCTDQNNCGTMDGKPLESQSCTYVAAQCGNGVVEAGEECDDGNLANADGCSSTCAVEQRGISILSSPNVVSSYLQQSQHGVGYWQGGFRLIFKDANELPKVVGSSSDYDIIVGIETYVGSLLRVPGSNTLKKFTGSTDFSTVTYEDCMGSLVQPGQFSPSMGLPPLDVTDFGNIRVLEPATFCVTARNGDLYKVAFSNFDRTKGTVGFVWELLLPPADTTSDDSGLGGDSGTVDSGAGDTSGTGTGTGDAGTDAGTDTGTVALTCTDDYNVNEVSENGYRGYNTDEEGNYDGSFCDPFDVNSEGCDVIEQCVDNGDGTAGWILRYS